MPEILSERLIYRRLDEKDVTEEYIYWLNDPVINRFLEVRHSPQTISSCLEFVKQTNLDPAQHLFGMFLVHFDKVQEEC